MTGPWEDYRRTQPDPYAGLGTPVDPYEGLGTPVAGSGPWDDYKRQATPSLREQYKAAIAKGGDENGNYPGTNIPVPGFGGLLQRRLSDPLGVQDEMIGAGGYIGSVAHDLLHGKAPDWTKADRAYEEGAERIRAEKEAYAERVGPGMAFATDLAGGMGTTGVGKLTQQGLSLAERIGSAAKSGAGFGAVAGAASAEGDMPERLKGAAVGAGTGALLAPAISEIAAPALTGAYKAIQNAPATVPQVLRTIVPGTRENIDERLMTTLARQNMTPADLRAQMAADQKAATFGNTTLDVPLSLADSGPAMQDLAYTIKAQPGIAKTQAEQFLEGRQRGLNGQSSQYDRMTDATRRSLRVTRDNAARTEDTLTAGRGVAADAAYNAFRNSGATIPVEDILQAHAADMAGEVTSNSDIAAMLRKAYGPFVDEARVVGATQGPNQAEQGRHVLQQMRLSRQIQAAEEAGDMATADALRNVQQGQATQFRGRTQPVDLTAPTSELSPAQFDQAKQQLDDMIGVEKRAGENYRVSILTDLKNRLVARADESTLVRDAAGNPVVNAQGQPRSLYAEARQSYATPTQRLEALEAGRNVLKQDPDRVAQQYGDLGSTAERRAYRVGSASAVTRQMGQARSGNNVAAQLDTPNVQAALRGVAGDGGAARLNSYSGLETRMFQTRNRVMGNSRTNENQNLTQDFTLATRLGRQLKEGNVLGAAGDLVASTIQRVYRYRETDARLLARDLFATDPAQREATIQRLERTYGQRQARAAVSTALQVGRQLAARAITAPVVNALAPRSDNSLSPPKDRIGRNALVDSIR